MQVEGSARVHTRNAFSRSISEFRATRRDYRVSDFRPFSPRYTDKLITKISRHIEKYITDSWFETGPLYRKNIVVFI